MVAGEVRQLEPRLKRIKFDEFLHGERPDGSLIGSYRNLAYASDKNKKNPLPGFPNVDLIQTGAFARSAVLFQPAKSVFAFKFTDSKAPKLLEKYNEGMTGQKSLTSLNQEKFNQILNAEAKKNLVKKIKQRLGQR